MSNMLIATNTVGFGVIVLAALPALFGKVMRLASLLLLLGMASMQAAQFIGNPLASKLMMVTSVAFIAASSILYFRHHLIARRSRA